jgi:UDP-glucose 4-epimerase
MRILVTGGAGYIGAHLVVELLGAGHDVVVVDDLSSGHVDALARAQSIAGRTCSLLVGDVADRDLMAQALDGVDTVMHLAAFKQVGESVARPERYFRNNVGGLASLLESMVEAGVSRIVYSSTAAVYGSHAPMPLREDSIACPDSPYGLTKLQGEGMLYQLARCRDWSAVSLRYFNPVGAHPSARIGEPIEFAASLVPRALKSLLHRNDRLTVFGTDYDTPDGTCLRDYIHIVDLARAHLLALRALDAPGHRVYNVGTGRPHSVLEVVAACERASGMRVPLLRGDRRPGDVPIALADPTRFREDMGFEARYGLDEMVASAWNWLVNNPRGYLQGRRFALLRPQLRRRAGDRPQSAL